MTLQSSGAISLLDVQNEFGGANPIGIDEYYAGGLYVPVGGGGGLASLSVNSGGKAPIHGSGAGAYPPSGWTGLQDGSVDDANVQINLPFTFYIDNTGYNTVFIGSNSYLTFGSGSNAYFALNTSNPALPKLMFGAADNSYQRVSTFTSGIDYVSVRYEGNNTTSGTVGSPGMVVELTLFNPSIFSGSNIIEMLVGNNNRTDGVSNISNSAGTAYATYTFSANTSYVFTGNSTGTSWSVLSGYFVSSSVGVPASGIISLADFYDTSAYVPNTQSGAITGSKSGGIRLWKWTSSGSFVIINPGYIDILVVGGGGRGYWGYGYAGGGGGGGGLIYIPSLYLGAGNYTVTIGASGSDTILYKNGSIYLRALAGGGNPNTGGTGGSGSGDGGTSNQNSLGGLSSTYGYGNNGGSYSYVDQGWNASGGGGGAGGVGGNGSGYYPQTCYEGYDGDGNYYNYCNTDYGNPHSVGGNGGSGLYYSIDINGSYYAGGGGGASGFSDNVSHIWGYPFGVGNGYAIPYGGAGGGGRGTSRGNGNGSDYTGPDNGTNGLGGGGGGGGPGNSNGYYTSGGSGVLIVSGSSNMFP